MSHLCRFCGSELEHTLLDLGMCPMGEHYLTREDLSGGEMFFPLHVRVCGDCLLAQAEMFKSPQELYHNKDYAYCTSCSEQRLIAARSYALTSVTQLGLNHRSLVVEAGSNDGYLLQFYRDMGIPVLGFEPAALPARHSIRKNIPTQEDFFCLRTVRKALAEGARADLLVCNYVLPFVPDLHDCFEAMHLLLKPGGLITIEVPYLPSLIAGNHIDYAYHENVWYFTVHSLESALREHGLTVCDVEQLSIYAGAIRVSVRHDRDASGRVNQRAMNFKSQEQAAGYTRPDCHGNFQDKADQAKQDLLAFLTRAKRAGKSVVGYGAPGKANGLLNFCGVRADLLSYTVDRNLYKQGRWLPGVHIPIFPPERLKETRPDYILILAYDFEREITAELSYVAQWGGRFVVPLPTLTQRPATRVTPAIMTDLSCTKQ